MAAAKRAATDVGDAIVEMDAFAPSGHDSATTSVSMVELADVYVGIIGLRWGSPVPEESDLSYTELEYRAATELGMERLIFLDTYRRQIGAQLSIQESRHQLARRIFHGQRGELRQRYREGQEDQLGALGLVLNAVVLWNTRYMDLALNELHA